MCACCCCLELEHPALKGINPKWLRTVAGGLEALIAYREHLPDRQLRAIYRVFFWPTLCCYKVLYLCWCSTERFHGHEYRENTWKQLTREMGGVGYEHKSVLMRRKMARVYCMCYIYVYCMCVVCPWCFLDMQHDLRASPDNVEKLRQLNQEYIKARVAAMKSRWIITEMRTSSFMIRDDDMRMFFYLLFRRACSIVLRIVFDLLFRILSSECNSYQFSWKWGRRNHVSLIDGLANCHYWGYVCRICVFCDVMRCYLLMCVLSFLAKSYARPLCCVCVLQYIRSCYMYAVCLVCFV